MSRRLRRGLALYARLLLRESRGAGGRIAFFLICLAVGVAAVVSVAGLSDGVAQGIRREARKLLAADVAVSSRQPLPEAVDRYVNDRADLAAARLKEMASVVAAPPAGDVPGRSQLAELKAVGGGYPFYGDLICDPPKPLADLLDAGTVVVAPDLLARLGVEVGGELLVGGESFRIAGVVRSEPDRVAGVFTAGPRVFLSQEGLARASLEQFGSRILYTLLIRLPDGAGATAAGTLAEDVRRAAGNPPDLRVETYADARPELREGLERLERFLGLVALLSLLLGGLGAAQTIRAWLAGRMDSVAILRCLGLRPTEVLGLYLGQAVLLGLVGSLLGAVAGLALQGVAHRFVADLLSIDSLDVWQPRAVGRGLLLGTGVALLFSLGPLLATRRVPPLRVLRRDVEPPRRGRPATLGLGVVLVAGIWLAASLQAGSYLRGGLFALGLVVAGALLAAVAAGLIRLVGLLRLGGPVWARHGLLALARPGAATVGAVVALGVGTLLIAGLRLVERGLADQVLSDLPTGAPTAFLVDIQPAQWEGVERLLQDEGAADIDSVPVVTARLTSVAGRSVGELAEERPEDRDRRWALTREQRLTYLERLPDDNHVIAGTLWGDPELPEVSVEEEFAGELGARLGDRLRFDVQGVPIELTVTSLRTVDWRTFGLNFFLVVEPGVLDAAPQFRIATARLPAGREQEVQDHLAAAFPNVTLIQVGEVLARVARVLGRLATAIRFLGGFTVLTGIVILAGAVTAASVRRGREIALLKTLGMTRPQVAAMLAVEYLLVGAVAGLVGTGGGSLLSWAVLTRGFEIDWQLQPAVLLAAVGLTVVLTAVTGVAASVPVLRRRPLETLRAE